MYLEKYNISSNTIKSSIDHGTDLVENWLMEQKGINLTQVISFLSSTEGKVKQLQEITNSTYGNDPMSTVNSVFQWYQKKN